MAAIDNANVTRTALEHAGRAPLPKVAGPRVAIDDNAGFKSFEMQNREVDAVKAATPVLAHSKSFCQVQRHDNFHSEQINGHHKDKGSSNETTNSDGGPYKAKKRSSTDKSKIVSQSINEDRPRPVSSDEPADAHQHTGVHTRCNPEPAHLKKKSRAGARAWSGGGDAQGLVCYSCGSLGHLSRDCKLSATDTALPVFNGTFRGRGRGRGVRGAGGGNRSSHFLRSQADGGFSTVHNGPRRLIDDKAPFLPQNATSQGTTNHSSPPQIDISIHGLRPRGMAFETRSGAWYPNHEAHAVMAPQMYGTPPPFVYPRVSQQVKPSQQASSHVLHPSPSAQTKDDHILPPSPCERTSLMTPDRTANIIAKMPKDAQDMHPIVSAKILDGPVSNKPARTSAANRDPTTTILLAKGDLSFIDPRPAHVRIESVMSSIAGELEYIKTRIHPSAKQGITPEDMARYLDMCVNLCQHVSKAVADLVGENNALKKHNMPCTAEAGRIGIPSDHDDGGLKISSTPRSRTNSCTASNVSADKVHQCRYILPSDAKTIYPPRSSRHQGYSIDEQSTARPVENEIVDSALEGPLW